MFRPMHMDLGEADQLLHNSYRIFLLCVKTETVDDLQSVLLVAGVADVVSVFAARIG